MVFFYIKKKIYRKYFIKKAKGHRRILYVLVANDMLFSDYDTQEVSHNGIDGDLEHTFSEEVKSESLFTKQSVKSTYFNTHT